MSLIYFSVRRSEGVKAAALADTLLLTWKESTALPAQRKLQRMASKKTETSVTWPQESEVCWQPRGACTWTFSQSSLKMRVQLAGTLILAL